MSEEAVPHTLEEFRAVLDSAELFSRVVAAEDGSRTLEFRADDYTFTVERDRIGWWVVNSPDGQEVWRCAWANDELIKQINWVLRLMGPAPKKRGKPRR